MDYLPHIATIVVALIGALAAIATQRSSARTNRITEQENNRSEMEKDAYERARAFDIATTTRQGALIDELNEDNDSLREIIRELRARLETYESGVMFTTLSDDNQALRAEVISLRERLAECEATH